MARALAAAAGLGTDFGRASTRPRFRRAEFVSGTDNDPAGFASGTTVGLCSRGGELCFCPALVLPAAVLSATLRLLPDDQPTLRIPAPVGLGAIPSLIRLSCGSPPLLSVLLILEL